MANRTVTDAKSVRGSNPQYLIEKIIRSRIYDSKYWKEECFALSAELLVDKAMELRYVGGVYGGNIKPSPFLCLILKMLQIQPEKDIIVEFIKNEEFKYVRALGAFYMRLVGTSVECYKYLEPLLIDGRKLRRQNREGKFELTHMDEYIDELLREERVFDIIMPRIQKRHVLEENNEIEPKISALDDDLDDDLDKSDDEMMHKSPKDRKRRDKKENRSDKHERDRDREKERDRKHRNSRRERGREHRSRSRDRERRHRDDHGGDRREREYREDYRERDREEYRDRGRDRKFDYY